MKRRAGITLIELLIAVSLLSLLTAGVLAALRLGMNALAKTQGWLAHNRRVAATQRILEQQIAGFIPVFAECRPQLDQPPVRIPFFQGEPQTMRFVSGFSLGQAWRGYPQILEFQVVPIAPGEGVRLVVNERMYTGPASAGSACAGLAPEPEIGLPVPRFVPVEVGPYSFVLADRLAHCRFAYKEELPPPVRERWVPRWIRSQWPAAIRVEMTPLERGAVHLRPLTLVAPVRINRLVTEVYGDW
ncbi:MAG: prepilin-type N-terminal cleavage/methylation domain-containing protein [Bryobacterales bacterium]|nr:prepilin-type N-terminal cleavage/methylation domain-containing protein [Bryobacteraceae bacterium]MDW8354434.1 prepilin-type N-terminal cleavage/methylation domain-containing protein [Bryobacterales bacterium]